MVAPTGCSFWSPVTRLVARDFGVGSQAECYDPEAVAETPEMLRAIYRIIPFSPVLVNPAAYEARFTRRIDDRVAEQVSRTIDEYGSQGMDYYVSMPDFTSEQDIIRSMVTEQRFHLWWD
jgi:hypothetical protein